jgi:solute carrier family 35 protein F1/2
MGGCEYLSFFLSPVFRPLYRGQIISCLIAGTGIFATLLAKNGFVFPSLMNLFNYSLLSIFLLRYNCRGWKSMICRSYLNIAYIFATVIDLEANYLVIKAYDYTTITSIMLLDCFTIPCAMALSYIFLKHRYNKWHFVGIVTCISGLLLIVISDAFQNRGDKATNAVYGDILCLSGSFLYATSNVLQEYLVKYHDRELFLGSLGLYGMFIASVQFFVLELKGIHQTNLNGKFWGFTAGFVVCLNLMYINTSSFLQEGDSTLFNLSLLTSDIYAVLASYFLFHTPVHWLYYIAFFFVVLGLIIYQYEPPIMSNIPDYKLFQNPFTNGKERLDSSNDEEFPIEDVENIIHTNGNNNNSPSPSVNVYRKISTDTKPMEPEDELPIIQSKDVQFATI